MFAELQRAGRAPVPWISDTFELDPESGIAHVILGPCSCAWGFVMYLWHQRCRSAAGRSCEATRKKLGGSGAVVVLCFLACLCLQGTLGFKIFSQYNASLAHFGCAVGFCVFSWIMTVMVTVIEYRSDIAPFGVTVARGILSGLMLGCMAGIAVAAVLWGCWFSWITNFSGAASGALLSGCVEAPAITDACLQRVVDSNPICVLAPACEIGAILMLVVWQMLMAYPFSTCRVLVDVRDGRFRALDALGDEELDDHHDSYLKKRQSGGSDVSVIGALRGAAREGDNLKSPCDLFSPIMPELSFGVGEEGGVLARHRHKRGASNGGTNGHAAGDGNGAGAGHGGLDLNSVFSSLMAMHKVCRVCF